MSKNPTESTSAANQLSMAQNETVSIIRANSLALSDAYFDNLKSHCELVSTYIESVWGLFNQQHLTIRSILQPK